MPPHSACVIQKRKLNTTAEINQALDEEPSDIDDYSSDSDLSGSESEFIHDEDSGEDDDPASEILRWEHARNHDPVIMNFQPTEPSGVTTNFNHGDGSESAFFENFMDTELLNHILIETNNYARIPNWVNVAMNELRTYIALLFAFSQVVKQNFRSYWEDGNNVTSTPNIKKYMKRSRFEEINRTLHFADLNSLDRNDRLSKARKLIEHVKKKFKSAYKPFQKLCIDESLVLFRGRVIFRQYIPSKRHRFGIKFFVLCDSVTGYILDYIVYSASAIDIPAVAKKDPIGFSGSVVKTLLGQDYIGKGHILYTDNYYTSPALADFLQKNNTGLCGTVKSNRKQMAKFPNKGPQGTMQKKKAGKLLAISYTDKRQVLLLSTVHKGDMIDTNKKNRLTGEVIRKPDAICDYNKHMRLVDKADMMSSYIDCTRKSRKWPSRLFQHILRLCMVNAFILFKQVNVGYKKSLREFTMTVVTQTLSRNATKVPHRLSGLTNEERFNCDGFLESIAGVGNRKSYRRCHVCLQTCLQEQRRKETAYRCKSCKTPLCIEPCNELFHRSLRY